MRSTLKRRFLAAMLIFVIIAGGAPNAFAEPPGGFITSISAPDPSAVKISTPEQLAGIANNLSGSYVLTNDISLSSYNGGKLSISGVFGGTLDGNGHVISGLILAEESISFALFDTIAQSGTVKNLGVRGGSEGRAYRAPAGGICVTNNGRIDNCFFEGEMSGLLPRLGGICGINNGTISNCYFDGNIYSEQIRQWDMAVGGIAAENTGSILGCYAKGSITVYGEALAGGIAALHNGGLIENCVNYSEVSATGVMGTAGGIAGETGVGNANPGPKISKCLSVGNITGRNEAAGISGWIEGWAEISNCVVVSNSIGSYWATWEDEERPAPRTAQIAASGHGYWEEGMPFIKMSNNLFVDIPDNYFYMRDANRTITRDEATQRETYTALGWDFNNVWHIVPGGYPELKSASAGKTALPTAAAVMVNGESVSFDAYNINDNNYFKLRDLAYTLSGTGRQFEVQWDGAQNAISLISGQAYTAVGGEMSGRGAGDKQAIPTTSRIYLDGAEVSFTAFNIDGNNYFKLRAAAAALNFGVDWDGARNMIIIDTAKGYTPG